MQKASHFASLAILLFPLLSYKTASNGEAKKKRTKGSRVWSLHTPAVKELPFSRHFYCVLSLYFHNANKISD